MRTSKSIIIVLIVLLAVGIISAQNAQSVSVKGTLQLRSGMIAVADGNTAYFIPMLGRYIGFIDGLKEGAKVSVEGYVSGDYLRPSKVTINGKSYDFQSPAYSDNTPGYGYGGHHCGMMGYGKHGHHGYGRGW
jgi:hypothetical protein